MLTDENRTEIIVRDILRCFLLSGITIIGYFVFSNIFGLVSLIDEEIAEYSFEYLQSLEGFRGSEIVASISDFSFWAIIGTLAYSLTLATIRTVSSIKRFYIIEKFYVNKRPFREDMRIIIINFLLLSGALLIAIWTVFLLLPFWIDMIIVAVATSQSVQSSIFFILLSYVGLALNFLSIAPFIRTYQKMQRSGL